MKVLKSVSLVLLIILIGSIYFGFVLMSYDEPLGEEAKLVDSAIDKKDIEELNRLVLSIKSSRWKLILLHHIEKINSLKSLPALFTLLSYDWPWWVYKSSIQIRPCEVRFSAFQVLVTYERLIIEEVQKRLANNSGYESLYLSAVKIQNGFVEYKEKLTEFEDDPKYQYDLVFVKRFLGL